MPTPTYRMLRCHIHKSSEKKTAAMATSASTRGAGFHVASPRRSANSTNGTNIAAASAMRQNADAVGPTCTHFTNTAEVLISTAPSNIAVSGPRGAATRVTAAGDSGTEFLGGRRIIKKKRKQSAT